MSRRQQIILGLLLTIGTACLPIGAWIDEFRNTAHLVAHEVIWWAIVAIALAYVVFVEHLPLSSVGFRPPGAVGIAIGCAAGVLILIGLGVILYAAFPALGLHDDTQMNKLIATPFWWRLISVTRAAVSEELVFRGYAIERLQELTGGRALAAIVSCAIFTLAHLGSWGWAHLIVVATAGGALTLLYLWRRNLWTNIVAHWLIDGSAFLLP